MKYILVLGYNVILIIWMPASQAKSHAGFSYFSGASLARHPPQNSSCFLLLTADFKVKRWCCDPLVELFYFE